MENSLKEKPTALDLINDILAVGYTDFLSIHLSDAASDITVKDIKDLEDALEEVTDEYSYTWRNEDEIEYAWKDESFLDVGDWKGEISWEEESIYGGYSKMRDVVQDTIRIDLKVEKDGVTLKEFLKERLDLED